jgi:hypothetical protein
MMSNWHPMLLNHHDLVQRLVELWWNYARAAKCGHSKADAIEQVAYRAVMSPRL